MFLRIKSFENKDGSKRHYLCLVETRRKGERIKQVTIANLGRLEHADELIPDIIEKLQKFHKNLKKLDVYKDLKEQEKRHRRQMVLNGFNSEDE